MTKRKKQTQKNKTKPEEVGMRYHLIKGWENFQRLRAWVQIVIASVILIGVHQLILH